MLWVLLLRDEKRDVVRDGSALTVVGRYKHPIGPGPIRNLEFHSGGSLPFFDSVRKGRRSGFRVAADSAIGPLRTNVPSIRKFIAFPIDAVDFGE